MSKVHDIVTEKIINALENGIVPWRKPWTSKMPQNLISKKPYRGINHFLLSLMPYGSPYWLTFKQAKDKGGKVMKGERSTLVVFWKMNKYKDKEGIEKVIPMLRYYNVFNLEQCEGIEAPKTEELAEIDFQPMEDAEAIANDYLEREGIDLLSGQAAFYMPSQDSITMPKRETFKTPEAYYSVMFHEMAHSTGHKSRLNRLSSCGFGTGPYAKEELVAEMSAAFICAELGIDNTLENSAAYIQGWLKKLKDDKTLLVSAAGKASKAANLIQDKKEVEV